MKGRLSGYLGVRKRLTQHVPEHGEKPRKDGDQPVTARGVHTDWRESRTGNGSQWTTAGRPQKVGKRVLTEPQLAG